MALVDYVSYNDIRAALGVSQDEIEDATLSLPLYEYDLVSELEDLDSSGTLSADFATVKALDDGTRTAEETKFFQATVMFCVYAVARHLGTSLPLFSPREITDGKAAAVRYAGDPYKETIKRIESSYERYRVRLQSAYAAYKSTSSPVRVTRSYFSVSTPDSDPILGT